MRIITREINAINVADRWAALYEKGTYGDDKLEILKNLRDLGSNPNPDDVDRIIGNCSWTSVGACDECGKPVEMVVQIGQEPDYESATACICKPCLVAASKL